ncbi:MarR family winged helix-turn-helix transcriptional regulator [Brevundimonas sp. NPDC058933]|uniref:MarR family winged helix-turn-helix transcriptional regulator n=1 Tax=Brevundimonas sp. NPDC058933 TaxID=3346673 RepID=UPI003BEF1A69
MTQDEDGRDAGSDDYSRGKGGQALGARLRRLSERIDSDGTRIYAARGVVFEQRWFGVLNQMILKGPTTVGEIAAALQITHVSVSQSCRSLQKAGIIRSAPDPVDARRRTLSLTPAGDALVERLTPLWEAFNAAAAELNEEAGNVVALLDRLDDALARKSMFERISERIDGRSSNRS